MGKVVLEWFPFESPYQGDDVVLEDQREGPPSGEYDDEDEDKRGVYGCATCRTHLAKSSSLVSKDFKGRSGKAFLIDSVVNFVSGQREDKVLITGKHTVADIACANCSQVVGWQYLHAYNESQRYKVGKFILERALVVKINFVVTNASSTAQTTTTALSGADMEEQEEEESEEEEEEEEDDDDDDEAMALVR